MAKYVCSNCKKLTWNGRCPVEDDRLVLGRERPLITGSENHTVFIKVFLTVIERECLLIFQNSIRFSYFGDHFHRNNIPTGRHICFYNFTDSSSWLCNIFRLGSFLERNFLFLLNFKKHFSCFLKHFSATSFLGVLFYLPPNISYSKSLETDVLLQFTISTDICMFFKYIFQNAKQHLLSRLVLSFPPKCMTGVQNERTIKKIYH